MTPNDNLPQDTSLALRLLIKTSEQLLDLSEKETQALIRNDMGTFAVLQDEKEIVSKKYAALAQEFHVRLEEFRPADRGLLDRLETLQNELGDKNKSNLKLIENMFNRSRDNIQSSLLTVQELAQKFPMKETKIKAESDKKNNTKTKKTS